MIFTTANFPIQGPIKNPTAEHYMAEAMLLTDQSFGARMDGDWTAAKRLIGMAEAFHRIARKLGWSPHPPESEERAA